MSNRLFWRILVYLWGRHKKGILAVSALAVFAIGSAVCYWWNYWETVWDDAWGLVESLSGVTKISLAATAASPVVAVFFRWLFTRRNEALKKEFLQEVVKPWVATIVLYLFLLVFYTVFIAQPKIYTQKSNELAGLTPPGSNTSYKVLADKLAESEAGRGKERIGRIQAEEQAERNRQQGIQWLLSATNTGSIIPALDQAIAFHRQDLKSGDTNHEIPMDIVVRQSANIKLLEQRRSIEAKKEQHNAFPALARYVVSSFENKFSSAVSNCGGKLESPPPIPSLDWILASGRPKTNSASTNCGVVFEYTYQAHPLGNPFTRISITGNKTVPAHAEFMSGAHVFISTLKVGDYTEQRRSESSDLTNCVKDVDHILNQLFRYKQKEFEK
jgi:hypothetical protein